LLASFFTFGHTFSAGMKFLPRSITPHEEIAPMAITKTNPFQTNVLRLTPPIKRDLNGQARILGQRTKHKQSLLTRLLEQEVIFLVGAYPYPDHVTFVLNAYGSVGPAYADRPNRSNPLEAQGWMSRIFF
jgi:hypothetical protein